MCDVQANEEMTPKAVLLGAKNTGPKLCIKCKEAQPNVLIRNIRYCKTCFLYTFQGKFRSIMNRANSTNDPSMKNILVGFSGGPSSRAMLQLLHQYTSSHNKYGELKILFIDESMATEDQRDHLVCIQKIAKLYPFELIIKRIEEPMGSKEAFLEAFSGLFSLTSREDFLSSLRHSLLVHTAREAKCSMLLLGDSATRIAIKTISLTSKGRGFSLPFEVAAESSCYEGLSIIRPMRDNLSKEVALYNHHTQLYHPSIKSILYNTKPKASIDRITEEFIAGLDSGFPSTVSTIVRTANKLTPSTNLAPGIWCPLCMNPAETNISAWIDSIAVRKLTSSPALEAPLDTVAELLCYSCRTSWQESKGIALPTYAVNYSEQQKSKRELLRSQIADFLLE